MAATLDPDALRSELEAARVESKRGRPALAATRYRSLRALIEQSGDRSAEVVGQRAQVLLGLASAEFELSGRLDASMSLLAQAERLSARAGSPGLLASVRGQRGLLLLRSGERRQALRAFDGAAEVRHQAQPYDRVSILLNRGVLHLDVGSLDQAAADFRECLSDALSTNDPLLTWKARHNLAYVDFLAGRLPRALAGMEAAERELDDDLPAIGLLDRARVLREAGLISDADQLLLRAAAEFARAGLHHDVGETNLVRAECALVEGDLQRARSLARTSARLFELRGNVLWQRRAQLLTLRGDRLALDTRPTARRRVALRRLAERAARLAAECRAERRLDLARSAALLETECRLRSTSLGRGRTDEPDDLDRTAPRVRATDPLESRLRTREVRALAAVHTGDRARAAAEVRRGLDELGSYQSGFGSVDLRTASAVHGLPLVRMGVDLAIRSGSPAEVFAAVERGRAVSTRLTPVGPPTDERTASLLTDLRRCDEEARSVTGDPHAGTTPAVLRNRAALLRRRIRARAWELEGDGGSAGRRSPRVSEIRAAARVTGQSFVSYAVHGGRLLAVLATGRRPRLFDLAGLSEVVELVQRVRADLDALAMPLLPPPLAEAVRRSLAAGLRRLDGLLVSPLDLGGSPLVVCGSSVLVALPWTLLPTLRGVPVVVTPSGSAWLRAGTSSRPARPCVVSVAGPGLHRADEEARLVRATWPGAELVIGEQATASALAGALAGADVVHVAAHGTHQQESPLFSSLRCADGPLYAYELDADGASADCVVLSACEAGLATVRPGDEGLGLTNVLLHLGTRSVLAGVARVRDDVAARVMGRVHQELAAGTDSARALSVVLAEEEEAAPFVAFGATW